VLDHALRSLFARAQELRRRRWAVHVGSVPHAPLLAGLAAVRPLCAAVRARSCLVKQALQARKPAAGRDEAVGTLA
jgi:hypothetical protein